jgi:carboxypeptidase Taq
LPIKTYLSLEKLFNRIHQLSHLGSIAHWDMAVMMPAGGSQARSASLAELSVIINEMLSKPQTGEWIRQTETAHNDLNNWQQANLREMKRVWINANSVDSKLVEAKSLAGSKCEHAWRTMRAENNWKDFLPLFKEVVKLSREEAKQRAAYTGMTVYDSMLNLYEPGLKSETIESVFHGLSNFLPEFIKQVVLHQKDELIIPQGPFPIEKQRELGLFLMEKTGFNFEHGRLDVSHHPFCGGVAEDVRITTRYNEDDFAESLMGVLHETGHAKYEQGLPGAWSTQPVGMARGMGIHESQSLFLEMQISRSKSFLFYAAPIIKKYLDNNQTDSRAWDVENLLKLNNRVKPDYIRVNADEVTYPLHIILRYEIEKALIEEEISAKELPDIWDEKMQDYLGLSTRGNYKDGCMQDIHWTDGSFGYFPTYTLGAMNAAQLFTAANKAIPDLLQHIEKGDFEALNEWQERLWSKGSYYSIDELMHKITGETLNPDYFIQHLKDRYNFN